VIVRASGLTPGSWPLQREQTLSAVTIDLAARGSPPAPPISSRPSKMRSTSSCSVGPWWRRLVLLLLALLLLLVVSVIVELVT
jgi:hypothetical protein